MTKDDSTKEWVPEPEHGTYSDGHPLDQIHYLECKIILEAKRFTSQKSFQDFGKLMAGVTRDTDVELSTAHLAGQKPQIREVVFLDTPDFRLYSNAFILRRRVVYEDGFPIGDPEIVFKFRHPDMRAAAEMDVRPQIPGVARTKFKAEALPLRDRLGGIRVLYSHNALLEASQMAEESRHSLIHLAGLFPCLESVAKDGPDTIELVNQMFVEEILVELGKLDFGKGVDAKTDVALWRSRGDHKPLAGEFSFQVKFDRRDELCERVKHRVETFFVALQQAAAEWVSLGTTKTGIVYGISGQSLRTHE